MYIAGSRVGRHPLITKDDFVADGKKSCKIGTEEKHALDPIKTTRHRKSKIAEWYRAQYQDRGSSYHLRRCCRVPIPTINAPATELFPVFEVLTQYTLVKIQMLKTDVSMSLTSLSK